MYKTIVALILFLISSSFGFGVNLGMNRTNVTPHHVNPQLGFSYGLIFESDFLSIETNWVFKHFEIKDLEYITYNNEHYRCQMHGDLGFFELPVLVRLIRKKAGSTFISFSAGYAYSFCFRDESENHDSVQIKTYTSTETIPDNFSTTRYSDSPFPSQWQNSSIGIRVDLKIEFDPFAFAIRYEREVLGRLKVIDNINLNKSGESGLLKVYLVYNLQNKQ